MDAPKRNPSPSPLRVLIRPPHSPSPPPPLPPPSSSDQPPPPPRSDGVVVVGVIARRHDDSAQLLNRLVDSNVFGSGGIDEPLLLDDDDAREWFNSRRISYFRDRHNGILFLQFCSTRCPVIHGFEDPAPGFDSVAEEQEFGDLQGTLFMFSEGSHFDTKILRNFRVLQAAKHAMVPFVRSQATPSQATTPPLPSRSHSLTSPSRPSPSGNNSSPGRGGGNLSRNASAISLMSGLGSEINHSGVRGATPVSAPLFSLDASRAVILLDQFSNKKGESLGFATGLVEDVLNGKATSDSLLLETHGQRSSKEDLMSLKEFISRQADILRGRGGPVNTNSGSAAGVGMVAVAAAAAAASAASGKTYTTPDLPNFEVWLTSSNHILSRVLCAKGGCLDELEMIKRKQRPRNTVLPAAEGSLKGTNTFDVAVSWLQSGRGLNTKFSTSWCQRAIPAAKEIYLKDLPPCYPTSQHEAHLEKALHAFHSMVKGPAVQLFAKNLEEECTSIWKSGRQLCDAVSLTGKPCMHQRHDVEIGSLDSGDSHKPHSSGYFFLHACACGRTRQLRPDPFDFESADAICFSDCDKLLPAVKLPEVKAVGPIQSSAWSLLRIGGARYYEPSKGLVQSGFCATQKFLLNWTIYLEKQKRPNGLTESTRKQDSVIQPPKVEHIADAKKTGVRQPYPAVQNGSEDHKTSLEIIKPDDKKISFGRGIPNHKMRKPFSEVVAGSVSADSGFPPLQQKKLPISVSEKGTKQSNPLNQSAERVNAATDHQLSQKSQDVSFTQGLVDSNGNNSNKGGDPFLRIGSNVVPVNRNGGERNQSHSSVKNVTVYVGFEHECPRGHRFLLNADHLTELGSLYSFSEESHRSSMEPTGRNQAYHAKVSKNASWGKVHQRSNEMHGAFINKERVVAKSSEMVANGDLTSDGLIYTSIPPKEHNLASMAELGKAPNHAKEFGRDLQAINMDGDDLAFSMLNRNLPIYMICPHCRNSRNKKDTPKVKFASGISQLKRIFMVTPPFPVILATCPNIQFETSCLPMSVPDRERKLQFNLGCQVILPPESFLILKLPFVYGVQLENGNKHPLNPFEIQPEMTAWITKGTALQILSKGSNEEGYQTQ
ncbi:hypothetical protein PIB30_055194 [Stylosanthes scabra]|uniref:Nonsense-mediated mRNA decay factor SMG8 n=1 Tax=Stylosanthes scabra TaxID=79078 RepID=A0ABU6ZHN0_9FABA|nr:hypothetical protein [Stylosanthes scabra]